MCVSTEPQEICLTVCARGSLKVFIPLPTRLGPAPCGFPPGWVCLLCISFSDRLRNKKKDYRGGKWQNDRQTLTFLECIYIWPFYNFVKKQQSPRVRQTEFNFNLELNSIICLSAYLPNESISSWSWVFCFMTYSSWVARRSFSSWSFSLAALSA